MSTPGPRINVRRAVAGDLPSLVQFNASMARETEGKSLDPARLELGVRAVLEREGLGF